MTNIISSLSERFGIKVADIERKHGVIPAAELFLLIVSLLICAVSMFINLIGVLGSLHETLKIEIMIVVALAFILTVLSIVNLVTIIGKKAGILSCKKNITE